MGKEDLLYSWDGRFEPRLVNAFLAIPREKFIALKYRSQAYEDVALSLIKGQTISQPSTVMDMLKALELKKDDIVLEIGGGSGYVGALLSLIVKKVVVAEIDEDLCKLCKKNLANYDVEISCMDGRKVMGKFDKILVSAAADFVPDELKNKLNKNGILVIPIGHPISKLMKLKDGKEEYLGDFIFVPLRD